MFPECIFPPVGLLYFGKPVGYATFRCEAVGLLDDLDKELNNFAMRLREWCPLRCRCCCWWWWVVVLHTHTHTFPQQLPAEVRLAFPRDGENRHGESGVCQGVFWGWQWDGSGTWLPPEAAGCWGCATHGAQDKGQGVDGSERWER